MSGTEVALNIGTQRSNRMRVLKQHLAGGSIRPLIVSEVQRVLAKYAGDPMIYEKCGVELGISPKTLRNWTASIDKGGWPELQPKIDTSLDRILGPEKKIKTQKTSTKKKAGKMPPPKKKGGNGGKPPLTLVK